MRLCPGCLGEQKQSASACSNCGHDLSPLKTKRTDRHCPDCDSPLLRYALGALPIEQCRGCDGLFLEKQDLEKLSADRAATPRERDAAAKGESHAHAAPSKREEVRYRRCPRCGRLMRHRMFGKGAGFVVLDMCEQHGTWFDRDELQKAVWFACDGTLKRDQHVEPKELRSRLEKLGREREAGQAASTGGVTDPAVWWGEELLFWLF